MSNSLLEIATRDDLNQIIPNWKQLMAERKSFQTALERIINFDAPNMPPRQIIEQIKKIAQKHLNMEVKY